MKTKNHSHNNVCINEHKNFSIVEKNGQIILKINNRQDPHDIPSICRVEEVNPDKIWYVLEDRVCPNCGAKLHVNQKHNRSIDGLFNVSITNYRCSNDECGDYTSASLDEFMPSGSRYSNKTIAHICGFGLISQEPYQKRAEQLKFSGIADITSDEIIKIENKYLDTFLDEALDFLKEYLEYTGKECSGILLYDESFPFINGRPHVRLILMDAITKVKLAEIKIPKKHFTKEFCRKFLKEHTKELNVNTIVTDGDPKYREIMDEMGVNHQVCTFHIEKYINTKIYKRLNPAENSKKETKKTIKKNNTKINRLRKKNSKETDKTKTNKKYLKRKNEIENLEDENSKLRIKLQKLNAEIKLYKHCTNKINVLFHSRTMKTAKKRFNKLWDEKDTLPDFFVKELKKIKKQWHRVFHYLINPDVPQTNNILENFNGVTLAHYYKHLYRTDTGIDRKTQMADIRWIIRIVIGFNSKDIIPVITEGIFKRVKEIIN